MQYNNSEYSKAVSLNVGTDQASKEHLYNDEGKTPVVSSQGKKMKLEKKLSAGQLV